MSESATAFDDMRDILPVSSDIVIEAANGNQLQQWRRKVATAASLGIMAVDSFLSEQAHLSQHLPQPLQAIAESMAHPVLGYMAAWFCATAVQRGWFRKLHGATTLTATTLVDAGVEIAQDLIMHPTAAQHFYASSQQLESLKDLGFAIGGATFYVAQEMLSNRDQPNVNEAAEMGLEQAAA